MIRPRTLRAKLAVWIALAVISAAVFHAGSAVFVFLMHERGEVDAGEVEDAAAEDAENRTVVLELAGAMALIAVVLSTTAAAAGLWLAGKALAPLRDAAERARAARAGSTSLLLPVRGLDDEWDRLASVVNDLLEDERRTTARARTFSANAAHELRTPLAAILLEVQVALRRKRTDEEYRAVLVGVEAEVTRLGGVVQALLALSRADQGELGARLERFDVAAIAADAVRGTKLAPEAGGERPRDGVALVVASTPALAQGDPALTRRVLDNLIDNALRHGGRDVEVRVGHERDVVVVSVTDDGPGLTPAVKERLFDRFNREPGASDGHGLGLSIAHALTRAMGGTLRFDASSPRTRFVVELPDASRTVAAPAG